MSQRIVVLAPHPDDEVLGVGGTIARYVNEGAEVHIVIMTRGMPPLVTEERMAKVTEEALAAHKLLGVKETHFLTFPAAGLDTVPHSEVNRELAGLLQKIKPDALYVPFNGDIHLDHQLAFLSAMVASRPNGPDYPRRIYAYETLSETNWYAPYVTVNFTPNVYVDITDTLEKKLQAMECFGTQLRPFPNERSLESLRALATLRGSTMGLHAAEAFVLIREVR